MVGDWVLDNLQQLLLGVCRANGKAVEELYHETGETLECTRDADSGGDFDEDAFGGCDVDLEEAGFVDWGVKEGEKTLKEVVLAMHS